MNKAFLIDGLVPSDGVVVAACHRTILPRIKVLLDREIQTREQDQEQSKTRIVDRMQVALQFLADQVGIAARLLHARNPFALPKIQGIDTTEQCLWLDLHHSIIPRLIFCFRNSKPISDVDKTPKALQALSYQLENALRFLDMETPTENDCPFVLYDSEGEIIFEPPVKETETVEA